MEAAGELPPAEEEATRASPPAYGGDWAAEQVMSEVHLGCPPSFSGPHLSHFSFYVPPGFGIFCGAEGEIDDDGSRQVVCSDEDGDLVLPRRRRLGLHRFRVMIQHSITSTIPLVGLQVWRAELVLADFVLHKMVTTSELEGTVSLELGAGTGLVGILLARVAESVFITDHGDNILENCAKNVKLNSGFMKNNAPVFVRELDWNKSWPPVVEKDNSLSKERYSWTESELEIVQRASFLFAADVIYSDDLTDALFRTLQKLMLHGLNKVLYLALEKRYNFSLNDLDIVANGYSHFRSYLRDGDEREEELQRASSRSFIGKRIDLLHLPQYVKDYDRGSDVELWQIKYDKPRL